MKQDRWNKGIRVQKHKSVEFLTISQTAVMTCCHGCSHMSGQHKHFKCMKKKLACFRVFTFLTD